jgi:hypothetical protein
LPTEAKVFYQLDCVGRHRIGGFAVTEFQHEEEVLLQPFASLLVERVVGLDDRPLICLRDISLVKVAIPPTISPAETKLVFRFSFGGETSDIPLPAPAKISDALAAGCRDPEGEVQGTAGVAGLGDGRLRRRDGANHHLDLQTYRRVTPDSMRGGSNIAAG